jgi:hypothetical protein
VDPGRLRAAAVITELFGATATDQHPTDIIVTDGLPGDPLDS